MAPIFSRPRFRAGINKQDTGLQNEGGYSDGNLVRFRQGLPEPIGGWQLLTAQGTFDGAARGNHSWRTLEGKPVYAFGTSADLYAIVGGQLRVITGALHDTVLEDVFVTESGSPIVTVYLPFHRLRIGDLVTFAHHQTAVAGLTIEGTFPVTTVLTSGRFQIDVGANANADETEPTGGYVDFYVPFPEGLGSTPITGYGTGPYGAGPYGSAPDNFQELRLWTLDNWGENLLANPSGYGIFEWQPETQYPELAYNGEFDGNANGWALGTGWAYSSGAVTATAGTGSNLSQDVDGILEGGRTYEVTFTVTRSAGSIRLRMNAGATPAVIDVGEASSPISKSGTYRRVFLCPADPKDIVFEKDAAFAGSIDNVSYRLMDRAYRLRTAPPRVDAMYVNPRGLVVAMGTTLIDGNYSPTAVRNTDLGNNRAWVPDTDSLASEYVLRGGGGRLMAGLATAEQDLVWGDDGVFSFQYQGQTGAAFDIRLLGTKCGLISRHAMAEQNGFVMWAANTRQFFIFRGIGADSLGKPELMACTVQEDVFDNLDTYQPLKCHMGINPEYAEAWFFYPDRRDGDECSRAVAVNWTDGTWMTHRMARTAWQSSGIFDNPIALSPDGRIFEHEVGNDANGALLDAWIETSDFDIEDGFTLMAIIGIIPDFRDQTGNLLFEISGRMYPNSEMMPFGSFVSTPTTPKVFPRCQARQMRLKISSQTIGGWWRLGALRLEIMKTGARQ